MNEVALIFPILSGLFFLIGFKIVSLITDKKRINVLAISLAFIVMIGIIFMDLLPEIMDISYRVSFSKNGKILIIIGCILAGIMILKLFDIFIPNHSHHHTEKEKNKEEHLGHQFHLGFVISCSLILHNILEGTSIYILTLENFTGGFLLAMAVGLHNLPLSIEIGSALEDNKNKKIVYGLKIALILSSFIGALILVLFKITISDMILLVLLSISLGMILYIALFELLREIYNYKTQKETLYGIIIGIILLLIMILID